MHIFMIINNTLSGKLVILAREHYANEKHCQCSKRECLEISGNSGGVGDKDLDNKMFEIRRFT